MTTDSSPGDSNPDSFESAAGPADGGSGNFKFYQVVVPDFTFNATGSDTTNTSGGSVKGTSFLRMGGFPTVTNPATFPPGFQSSLTLANLVGASVAPGQDTPDATYGGDPNYLLGFADDTRSRGASPTTETLVDTASVGNSVANRKKETATLLTKGGWWDHSDGNRISTTAGDKIEIIQGNYKMVVLGRQPMATPTDLAPYALITDISGGLMEENGPAPNHCIKTIEWSQDHHNVWSVYQNNGDGNVYSSFFGDTGDLLIGQHQETWRGLAPPGFPVSTFYTNTIAQRVVEGDAAPPPDPVITEYTWATSIVSYTGSTQKWIPTITENTYANSISSVTHADTIDGQTYVDAITSETFAAITVSNFTTAPLIEDVTIAANKFSLTVAIQENIALPLVFDVSLAKIDIGVDKLHVTIDENGINASKKEAIATQEKLTGIENTLAGTQNGIASVSNQLVNAENRIADQVSSLGYRATRLEVETVHIGETYDCWYGENNIGF